MMSGITWSALLQGHQLIAMLLLAASLTTATDNRRPLSMPDVAEPQDIAGSRVENINSEMHLAPVPRRPESVIPELYYTASHNVSPHHYRYVINNPNICMERTKVLLLIAVRTMAAHVNRRMAIRDTWAATFNIPEVNTPLVFLIGAARDTREQVEVNLENRIYRDIIQEDFVDSVYNQTLKAVMAFRWARMYCPHTTFVMIAQDDAVVDVFKLVPYLQSLQYKNSLSEQVTMCYLYRCCILATPHTGATPHKGPDYAGHQYPAHISPSVFVASASLIHRLYLMSLDTPMFTPEGPWLGVIAEKLGLSYSKTFTSYVGLDPKETPAEFMKSFNRSDYLSTPVIFGVTADKFPGHESEMVRRLWSIIVSHHRDKPTMDVNHYMNGQKVDSDSHIYQVALAALLIDMCVMAIVGYIIFCRKRTKVVPFHASTHYHYTQSR